MIYKAFVRKKTVAYLRSSHQQIVNCPMDRKWKTNYEFYVIKTNYVSISTTNDRNSLTRPYHVCPEGTLSNINKKIQRKK